MRNRTKDTLDNQLVNRLMTVEKTLRETTTAQPIGGDVFKVVKSSTVIIGPITCAPSSSFTFNTEFELLPSGQTLWHFRDSMYVDIYDAGHLWPSHSGGGASSLTGGQRNAIKQSWCDTEDSNDGSGIVVYKIRVTNQDASSHDYYFNVVAYVPQAALG